MHMLVLVQGYPSASRPYNLAYVHARVLAYRQAGFDVTVLSFGANECYVHEGIQVETEASVSRQIVFDVCVSHAPNLRNHLRWMWRYQHIWKKTIWVLHGHEVLIKQNYYPAPYRWDKRLNPFYRWADKTYDRMKVQVLARAIRHWLKQQKLHLIFVSDWMRQSFLDCVPIEPSVIDGHFTIAPNPIHPTFLTHRWNPQKIRADFVTIRPLDEPKYALDVVIELAKGHPDLRFDIFGQGRYFQFNPPPANVHWQNHFWTQEELPEILNHYRAALMPTRLDAQGVMNCEMAMLGMPVLTTDLPICREMLGAFPRVGFFSLEHLEQVKLLDFLTYIAVQEPGPLTRFSNSQTIEREILAIQDFVD